MSCLISPLDDVRLVVPVLPRPVRVDVGVDARATGQRHLHSPEKCQSDAITSCTHHLIIEFIDTERSSKFKG